MQKRTVFRIQSSSITEHRTIFFELENYPYSISVGDRIELTQQLAARVIENCHQIFNSTLICTAEIDPRDFKWLHEMAEKYMTRGENYGNWSTGLRC